MTIPGAYLLSLDELHSSVADPLLTAMNFLNEVVSRYPDAISFAPGRPYQGSFAVGNIAAYLTVYTDYLATEKGWSDQQIRTNLFQYGRTNGHIHELVARAVANDEGIRVDPAAVVITVGAQEGMLLVLRTLFASPNDVLLVSSPSYVGITGVARLLDIELAPVPEGPHGIDPLILTEVASQIRTAGKRPRAVYLVPDFANPSGVSLSTQVRRELLAAAEQAALLVLEDNPYGFFIRGGKPRPTLKSLDNTQRVIYIGSFAKTCFPGARVGYVLADQPVIGPAGYRTLLADELSKVKSMTTVNTPALSQAVIGGMLLANNCRLRAANADAISFYQANLQTMLNELERYFPKHKRERLGIHWNCPDGGFFVVMQVPFDANNAALERSARQYGVLWTPMSYFHIDGGGTKQLRLACSAVPRQHIREGITRLAAFATDTADGRR